MRARAQRSRFTSPPGRRARRLASLWALALLAGLTGAAPAARAEEYAPLVLMGERAPYLQAPSAFEADDPFDLDVRLSVVQARTHATIAREQGRDPRGGFKHVVLGRYTHIETRLALGLALGLFPGGGVYARLPLVLEDTRTLTPRLERPGGLLDAVPGGAPLFDFGGVGRLSGPTRSGIESVTVGVQAAVLSQDRDPDRPTWLWRVETRLGVGHLMAPCVAGRTDDAGEVVPCGSGVSTGEHALRVETRLGRRYRFAEPYAGFAFEAAWAARAKDAFEPDGDLRGYGRSRPPWRSAWTAGLALVPWENRARYQRVVLDLRADATYVSRGRDYAPLYDALGASTNPYLTTPACEAPGASAPGACAAGGYRQARFTGITEVGAHGRVGGRMSIDLRPARFVRFRLTAGLHYDTAHLITGGAACRGSGDAGEDAARAEGCDQGVFDPRYRAAIDAPGHRFFEAGAVTLDIGATASAMF